MGAKAGKKAAGKGRKGPSAKASKPTSAKGRKATPAKGVKAAPGKDGKGHGKDIVRCPLCGRPVRHSGGDAPTALNRHFETDCTWRHTNRSPVKPKRKE